MAALAVISPWMQRGDWLAFHIYFHPSHAKYLPFAADDGHYHYKALFPGLLQLQDICLTVEND